MIRNQTPEQLARDHIDRLLVASGCVIQNKQQLNLAASTGFAVSVYSTEVGPADYVLFVHQRPLVIIEAKREDESVRLSSHESQVEEYAQAKLKCIDNQPLSFLYISTGTVTKFTDKKETSPCYREIFSF